MTAGPHRWADDPRPDRYRDLDHPADLWIEVRGDTLADLAGNALFALFDTLLETEGLDAERSVCVDVKDTGPAEALRALLAEALFLFDAEGFGATGAVVNAEMRLEPPLTQMHAELWGQDLPPSYPGLRTEVKAVTHHRLLVESDPDRGWTASLLFDV
jgi:SHS2 domain-containing protein